MLPSIDRRLSSVLQAPEDPIAARRRQSAVMRQKYDSEAAVKRETEEEAEQVLQSINRRGSGLTSSIGFEQSAIAKDALASVAKGKRATGKMSIVGNADMSIAGSLARGSIKNPATHASRVPTSSSLEEETTKEEAAAPYFASESSSSPRKSVAMALMLLEEHPYSPSASSGEDDSSATGEDEQDEDQNEELMNSKHAETMRKARASTRLTIAPTQLLESVTSRWNHFSEQRVVALIEQKADVHARLDEPWDRSFEEYGQTIGATTLHFAARRGLLEVVRALLEHHADIAAATERGMTPLMVAVVFNQLEAVRALFNEKASVLQKDQAGISAVDLAVLEGHREMIESIVIFEQEEDKTRNEKVREEMERLAKEESSDDPISEQEDRGLGDEASFGGEETRLERQQRINAGGVAPADKRQATSKTMRSGHLLPAALRKTGLANHVPTSPTAQQGGASPGGRRPQGCKTLTAGRRGSANTVPSSRGSGVNRGSTIDNITKMIDP